MAQGFGGDMGSLLKQAQEMQKRVQDTERDLAERILEGSAGGGAVKVYVNGLQEVQAVKIDPEAVDPDDIEELEDLVVAAVRAAMEEARKMSAEETGRITGGMGMPFGM